MNLIECQAPASKDVSTKTERRSESTCGDRRFSVGRSSPRAFARAHFPGARSIRVRQPRSATRAHTRRSTTSAQRTDPGWFVRDGCRLLRRTGGKPAVTRNAGAHGTRTCSRGERKRSWDADASLAPNRRVLPSPSCKKSAPCGVNRMRGPKRKGHLAYRPPQPRLLSDPLWPFNAGGDSVEPGELGGLAAEFKRLCAGQQWLTRQPAGVEPPPRDITGARSDESSADDQTPGADRRRSPGDAAGPRSRRERRVRRDRDGR